MAAGRKNGVRRLPMMGVVVLCVTCLAWQPLSTPSQSASAGSATPTQAAPDPAVVKQLPQLARQKLLAEQAERLVTMANQLKADVDKTNKNILSLDVIRKAEQIEVLARQMKTQSGR